MRMPRPGPRRPNVNVRIGEDGIAHLDQRARDEGLVKDDGAANRSEIIRLMLAYAAAHMPRGWRPKPKGR